MIKTVKQTAAAAALLGLLAPGAYSAPDFPEVASIQGSAVSGTVAIVPALSEMTARLLGGPLVERCGERNRHTVFMDVKADW